MRPSGRMMEKLLEVNMSPDFLTIEDRGHTYGHDLSDQDKQALIEYMKYFKGSDRPTLLPERRRCGRRSIAKAIKAINAAAS